MQNLKSSSNDLQDYISSLLERFSEQVASNVVYRLSGRLDQKQTIQTEPIRLYGDRSVAKHLGCTVQTINQLKKSGKLPFHRVGRKYYYIQSEVDQAFMGNTHKFKK
jgi:excisionase family DNA binding protein